MKTCARTTDKSPVAVVDADRMRRVLCCNQNALRAGIRPGHTFNAAIAICRDVTLLSRNLGAEATLLNDIATACEKFTPTIVVEPPNELLLDVRGSLRLSVAQPHSLISCVALFSTSAYLQPSL